MYNPEKEAREALCRCLRTVYSPPSQDEAIPEPMRALLEKIAARTNGEHNPD